MCGPGGYHGHHSYGGWCCCDPAAWGPGFPFGRRFPTREERIAWLEEYLKDLQDEVKAVEERIAEMKAIG
ncbi:MAG: hypothetical protein NUW24_07260 [Anaerolineae bacterium]|jgi:hypothetical protein|nr:hypothetical protein [Anaerolineae bacterium]MDH7475240.1 hypothetical protein [Anaerolineae bacterium]